MEVMQELKMKHKNFGVGSLMISGMYIKQNKFLYFLISPRIHACCVHTAKAQLDQTLHMCIFGETTFFFRGAVVEWLSARLWRRKSPYRVSSRCCD